MDAQRAVLLALMPQTMGAAIMDFRDSRVCKNYLVGLCPPELFTNTKFQLPACSQVHDDHLKQSYQEASSRPGGPSFEGPLLYTLEDIVTKNDRIASMEVRKMEESEGPHCMIPRVEVLRVAEVEAIDEEIGAKLKEATALLDAGNSLKAVQLEEEVEALRRKKCLAQARSSRAALPPPPGDRVYHAKMRACSGCGHFLNLVDADDRMADHFQGRGHLGFVVASQWIAKLKEKLRAGPGGGRR